MSSFGGLLQTRRGRNLQAKAQTGVKLQYTRIALGDGQLGSTPIADLNALRNQKKSLDIQKLNVLTGGRALVGSTLSNQDMQEGFYFREIGIFAQDPDVGEVLYCYGNAGELAEYIPPAGGADVIEKSINIQTTIGNAQNVTAVIDDSLVFATEKRLQELEESITQQMENMDAVTTEELEQELTKLENKLGNLSELQTEEKENVVQAINEVRQALTAHQADYTYQTPTIAGEQIRITKQSDANRLYFKLDDNLTGGNITISTDGGATEKPLQDVDGNPVTLLEKGFVEVVADATFFTLRNRGISGGDKQALIDIANEATANDSDLKAQFISDILSKDPNADISASSTWQETLNGLANMEMGKKWATGTVSRPDDSRYWMRQWNSTNTGQQYKAILIGLEFRPNLIIGNIEDSPTIMRPHIVDFTGAIFNYYPAYTAGAVSILEDHQNNFGIFEQEDGTFTVHIPLYGTSNVLKWIAFE
jgi:hypothetical protein